MRRIASAIVAAAVLASTPSRAFDPAGADIIGLRLGMPEAEVLVRLAQQGYPVSPSSEAITASTKDGRLRVAVSAEWGTTQISYTFYGRDPGAPEKIQEAIIARFGDPDQATPMMWCQAVGRDGRCPADQASLTYFPDSLTLRLKGAVEEQNNCNLQLLQGQGRQSRLNK